MNTRCRLVVEALRAAAERARALKCDAFFVLGDLYDGVRPEQQIVAEVQRALVKAPSPYVLLGNHDMVSIADGDHALGPLAPVATVIDEPTYYDLYGASVFAVPFQPGPAIEWLPALMHETFGDSRSDRKGLLLLHLGLSDDATPKWLQGAHDSVPASLVAELCAKYGFAAAFAGNWHFHKMLHARPFVYQVGTLVPTGFDNPSLEGVGVMMVWDTATGRATVEHTPGPRFVKLRYGDPRQFLYEPEAKSCKVYLSVTAAAQDVPAALADLGTLKATGIVADGEVLADAVEVETAAREAAQAASSATTLDSSLAAFVQAMPLDDGVNRDAVLAAARHYLGM